MAETISTTLLLQTVAQRINHLRSFFRFFSLGKQFIGLVVITLINYLPWNDDYFFVETFSLLWIVAHISNFANLDAFYVIRILELSL